MSAPPRIPLFFNARAGGGATTATELAQRFDADVVEIRSTEPAQLAAALRRAVAAGVPVIAVAGGDGSMRSAAAALIDTHCVLLPVPTGSLNHFARRCGIMNVDDAATALRSPIIRTRSVGIADGSVFLNTLTLGEYARTVQFRERWRQYLGKWPAALLGFMVTILAVRRIEVTFETEGESFARRTPFVWIGIGWGSFPRVHQALERRDRPHLEVAVVRSGSRGADFAFLRRLSWRMLLGHQPVRDDALEVLHTRSLSLAARHTIQATADGEVLQLPPQLNVTVRDDALRVMIGPAQVTSEETAP